jgi:hypothetical protein
MLPLGNGVHPCRRLFAKAIFETREVYLVKE